MKKQSDDVANEITKLVKYIYNNVDGNFEFKEAYDSAGCNPDLYNKIYEITVNFEHIIIYNDSGQNKKVVLSKLGRQIIKWGSFQTLQFWLSVKYWLDSWHWLATIIIGGLTLYNTCNSNELNSNQKVKSQQNQESQ